jgi:uncharacterized protein (DUF2384 family)
VYVCTSSSSGTYFTTLSAATLQIKRRMEGSYVQDELERIWREARVEHLSYYHRIFVERMKIHYEDSQFG